MMGEDRRTTLRLVQPGDPPGGAAQGRPRHDEPVVTVKSLLVALFIATVAGGLSFGFFDWLPAWVHAAVFAAAFALMALFGRRIACSG